MLTGGCLCGAVRYEAGGKPLGQAVCHCRNCQKQGGSAFSALITVDASQLTVTGATKLYVDHGDSGQPVHRHFCGDCGSPLYSVLPANAALAHLKAGTLDDPSIMAPRVNIWCDSAWPSTLFPENAIRIPRNPPG